MSMLFKTMASRFSFSASRLAGSQVVAPALSTRALPPRTLSTRASMGKGDLIKHVAAEADLTPAAADRAVNALLDVIMDKVAKGELQSGPQAVWSSSFNLQTPQSPASLE